MAYKNKGTEVVGISYEQFDYFMYMLLLPLICGQVYRKQALGDYTENKQCLPKFLE
jgi:hypothetical protein